MIKASDSPSKMTAREHAAMTLKVPNSGTEWLDSMIQAARDLDAEAFQVKMQEPQGSVAFPDVSNPTTHAPQGKATRSPQGPKDRPAGGAGTKIG